MISLLIDEDEDEDEDVLFYELTLEGSIEFVLMRHSHPSEINYFSVTSARYDAISRLIQLSQCALSNLRANGFSFIDDQRVVVFNLD